MDQEKRHNKLEAVDEQSKRFFSGGEFLWEKNKTEVWNEMEVLLGEQRQRVISLSFNTVRWAAAAVIIIVISIGSFMRFSTKVVETLASEHQQVSLPDGSDVILNAQSKIIYHPHWWFFKRQIAFEGEALFSVKKGKKFTVVSKNARTQVLGTRFNIFSRADTYKVTCLEGSVRVVSNIGKEIILKPNDKATVLPEGTIKLQNNIEVLPEISWKDYTFFFTSVPLSNVFSEIERQYDVKINVKADVNVLYTGNFSKNQNVEEVLGYICPALGYTFIRLSNKSYSIIPDTK